MLCCPAAPLLTPRSCFCPHAGLLHPPGSRRGPKRTAAQDPTKAGTPRAAGTGCPAPVSPGCPRAAPVLVAGSHGQHERSQ